MSVLCLPALTPLADEYSSRRPDKGRRALFFGTLRAAGSDPIRIPHDATRVQVKKRGQGFPNVMACVP